MNKIIVGGVFMVLCLLFTVGYLIGINNINNSRQNIIDDLPKTGEETDNIVIIQGVSDNVTLQVLQETAPEIISKLDDNPQNLETLQPLSDCLDKTNCINETSIPPYQWIRYAQYYNAKALKQTPPTAKILSDLFLYPDESYYMRLYQYGDIIIDSQISDSKYKEKYLEIFDKSVVEGDFAFFENYNYYSAANPLGDEKLDGGQISKGQNNGILVMDYSTNAVTAANAYIMTKDSKYLNLMNNILYLLSITNYFDGEAANTLGNPTKYSTCYSLLATVKAFAVTQDKQYLQLTKDMILGENNYLQEFYSLAPSQMDKYSSDPMSVLPCIEALNILKLSDTENNAVYTSTYETIYNFLVDNNIINTSKGYGSFGMMIIANKMDVNSTAWLVKILSENIINNEK
jgi:hypothetical protein